MKELDFNFKSFGKHKIEKLSQSGDCFRVFFDEGYVKQFNININVEKVYYEDDVAGGCQDRRHIFSANQIKEIENTFRRYKFDF